MTLAWAVVVRWGNEVLDVSRLGNEMKKLVQFCVGVLLGTGFAIQTAKAGNITINDTLLGAGTYFGGGPLGKGGEDQETEPNTVGAQAWDLEAFSGENRSRMR